MFLTDIGKLIESRNSNNNNKLLNHFTGLGFVIGAGIGSALGP